MADNFKKIMRVPSHRLLARADFRGKRVLVRVDFNVPVKDGKVEDTRRIDAEIPTLKKILERGAKEINIICHFGRPAGVDKKFSTAPIAKILAEKLKVKFDPKPQKTTQKSPALKSYYQLGDKFRLFENLRFDPREEKNSSEFARELAELGDVFVQDAFANIHRKHTSMVKLQEILPTYAGLLVEREINFLFRFLAAPEKPFVAIIGGAKIEDKLPVIEALSKKADAVLIGGATANEWILDHHKKTGNVFLPSDGINKLGAIVPINEQTIKNGIFDIGPQTLLLYKSILATAKTIFWNGNLGMTENKRFVHGTYELTRYIAKLKAEKVASGGNTADVIDYLKLNDRFDFISTGGSATSDLITGKKLPALEMLLK